MSFCLTTLIENHPAKDLRFCCEHGLSVLIQTERQTILFDTGQTGAFLKNAELLHIDLEKLDAIILSHGHYDHTGGLMELLHSLHNRPKIWVGKSFFEQKCHEEENGTYRYNGNSFTVQDICRLGFPLNIVTEDQTELGDGVTLFKNFPMDSNQELSHFHLKKENFPTDDFADELVLGLSMPYGMTVLTGCSHRGILSIMSTIQKRSNQPLIGMIGGTHLLHADEARLGEVIESFKKLPLKLIALSHCTGDLQMDKLQQTFPNIFFCNRTGSRVFLKNNGIFCEDI